MPQQQQHRLTDAQRLAICEWAEDGMSVRQIADRLKVAPSTVTRNARQMGLAFDRSATAAATSARIADAKARRAKVAAKLLDLADRELDQLTRPYRASAFVGGQAAGFYQHVLPRPDASARLAIARTAATLLDKHLRLAELDDGGLDHTKSMLGSIYQSLVQAYGDDASSIGENSQT